MMEKVIKFLSKPIVWITGVVISVAVGVIVGVRTYVNSKIK